MATTEKRTIEIVARVADVASRPLQTIGKSIAKLSIDGVRDFGRLVGSIFSVRTAIAGVLGGFAAFRGGAAITGIVESVDQLDKLARGTGSTTERQLALQQAFQLSNVAADRYRTLIASLTKGVGAVLSDQTSKQAKSFAELGLSVEDLRTKDPVELLDRMAGSLERFPTAQEKAAALLKVFPKAAGDIELLIDVLGQGQAQFRNLVATAQFFGGSIDQDGVQAVVRLNGALDVLKLSLEGIGRTATVAIAQQLAPMIERLATFFAQNRDRIAGVLATVVTAIAKAVLQITAALIRLFAFFSANGEKFVEGLEEIPLLGEKIAEQRDLLEALEEIPLLGEKIAEGFRKVFDVRTVAPGARAIRDEIEKLANAERKAIDDREQLAKQAEQMELQPGEFSAEAIANTRRRMEELERDRKAFFVRMLELSEEFADKQRGGGGTGDTLNEVERQREAAKMRAFAGDLSDLASFDNLPAPPTNLSPIIRALFGADGVSGAQERTRSFFEGVNDGLSKATEKWTDFGQAGENAALQVVDGGLEGVVDALADGATQTKSWNRAWKDFSAQVLSDIARIIARLIVMKAIQAATGTFGININFERGGVMPGSIEKTMPVQAFESGGIVRRPTVAIFGEGRNKGKGEAFVPLPDGRRIPVALMNGSGDVAVNIYLQAWDGVDAARALYNQRGTLRALWQHDVSRVRGVRQNLKGAAR